MKSQFVQIKDQALSKQMKAGEASNEEVAQYLLKNYNAWDIAVALAEILILHDSEITEPIPITMEQFSSHFRILGYKKGSDGTLQKENRGRKPGTKVVDGKVVTNDNDQA
jgi:hypothetical protein